MNKSGIIETEPKNEIEDVLKYIESDKNMEVDNKDSDEDSCVTTEEISTYESEDSEIEKKEISKKKDNNKKNKKKKEEKPKKIETKEIEKKYNDLKDDILDIIKRKSYGKNNIIKISNTMLYKDIQNLKFKTL